MSFEDIHDYLNHVNLNYLFRKIFLKVKVFSVLGSVAFLALALTEGVLLFGATPAEHFHAVATETKGQKVIIKTINLPTETTN